MKTNLLVKYLTGFAFFIVLSFAILCTFTQNSLNDYLERHEAQQLYRESSQIASVYAASFLNHSLSLEDFQMEMHTLSKYLSADIWIMDNRGRILFDSADSQIGRNAAIAEFKVVSDFDTADFGSSFYRIGDFYGFFPERTLTVFSPVTNNYRVRNYVLIHKPISKIADPSNELMNISFFTVSLVCSAALFLLLFFLAFVYLPVRKIIGVAKCYAKGNFEPVVKLHSSDELGLIANTMNYMANELNTLEEDQRKFISNVSHDFRSPLTSIKGYVEAMQDGTIPPELQGKYFDIILFETRRLTKLTQGILDLNRYGHRGIRLDLADFDINQMIRNTILTFEGTCEKKELTFDLVLTGRELFVTADMTKIQQVLYNLIDNATKFSHHNSSIKIETSLKNEKVLVSVKDSGIGIPADSVGKIWDRFYKTDLSRGKDKKGTGLGLSIVKEIIQAHNQHINVISTEGVGTEFLFTLPLSKKEVQ